ncbi:MAG: subclass B1 metallo-beta-lactamase [Bacteroidota bacterium]
MNKITFYLLCVLFLFNCSSQKNALSVYKSNILNVKSIDQDLFVHVSYLQTNYFGKVACNGMVYFRGDEAIVFDTPADNEASKVLIHWIQNDQNKTIKALVVTHFHEDCLGGIEEFEKNGVVSYSNQKTIEILKSKGELKLPNHGFNTSMTIKIGDDMIQLHFFGEGHTKDNIVGYIPNKSAFFGGCLIKSLNAGKGFTGDANVEEWSTTVSRLKTRLPNLKTVIPGHGKHGGKELLDFTIELFRIE